jgi:transglutaminase-like putative cysteine protease/predicted tellurium resistance membrane protein TerC
MSTSTTEGMTSQQWSMTVTPVVAALTTLCASTAIAGVVDGLRWLGYAGVAVIVVTATGLGLRAIRTPVLVVGLAQMFAVLCLLVALFTNAGILGVLPGPAAISELGDVLQRSVEVVRTGVPPVDPTAAVLCLVVIAIGLVAVLVDTLAVAAGTPAACGLVLLCVYAVPASLADKMLPWWSFVLGASSFALLLAVDGAHRHQQWRNRPALPNTGGGFGSPVAQVSTALVIALLAGSAFTVIGTVGQLPGGGGSGGPGGLGLKPFTQLRGMLDQGTNRELFRVHGLGQDALYMRMITLSQFDRNGGWSVKQPIDPGVSATQGELPVPKGTRQLGRTTRIDVETVADYQDLYAGVYGIPKRFQGLPGAMRYDTGTGMVFREDRRRLQRYTEEVDLSLPNGDALRAAGTDYSEIDRSYFATNGISAKVTDLARELTAGKATPYDKAFALQKYFSEAHGFKYDQQTASGSDANALNDFLFNSKKGFCEQFASAMGILARAAGLPSRVAIGYTGGFIAGDYRSITTSDAHAWVEIYFPGQGWAMFDPTPLIDGRTFTPPYAQETVGSAPSDDPNTDSANPGDPSTAAPPTPRQDKDDPDPGGAVGAAQQQAAPAWIGWTTGGVAVIALLVSVLAMLAAGGLLPARIRRRVLIPVAVICWLLAITLAAALVSWWLSALIVALTLAAAPGFIREWRRRARRHAVHRNQPMAASAAWEELLAESVDRGAELIDAETVRMTARRLAREHDLDDDGKLALRTVVSAVERSWYSARAGTDPALPPAFDALVAGLRRTSPLALRARLLPRSVLRRLHRKRTPAD